MNKLADRNILPLALIVEGGLGVVALGIGLLVGINPLGSIQFDSASAAANVQAIGWGLLATVPLVALLIVSQRIELAPLLRLRRLLDEVVVPLFARLNIFEVALISLAAGLGEEMLFRGLIQAGLAQWISGPLHVWLALLIASVAFGACHWLTHTYAVLAMVIGLYLGWLFIATENLLTPITAHAAYDFVALIYLVKSPRSARTKKGGPNDVDRTALNLPDQMNFPNEEVSEAD